MSESTENTASNVVSSSAALARRFGEIEAAFKTSPDGKTIEGGEALFRQMIEEMESFATVMQTMKVRLMFAAQGGHFGVWPRYCLVYR